MQAGKLSEAAALGRADGMSPSVPRVFILSDVRLYRDGLLQCLRRLRALEILGAADLSAAAVARVIGLHPDAVILDIGAVESFATARLLGVGLPTVKVVAFAVAEIDHLVLACAEAGIAGYVGRDGSEEDLLAAIEYALRGELYCSSRIAGVLSRHIAVLSAEASRPHEYVSLTRRERQILSLVGEGMSNKEIGRALRIGNSTVKNHVHNILEKLQVHRRGEAAARFRDHRPGLQRRAFERAPLPADVARECEPETAERIEAPALLWTC